MKKLNFLWTGEFEEEGYKLFSQYGDIRMTEFPKNPRVGWMKDEKEIVEALKGMDVFICGYEKITKEILYKCPDLKLILSVRDGPEENIDVQACEELGIPVLSSAGRCATSVSELTLALMLLCARPIIKVTNTIHEIGWTKENNQDIRALYSEFSTELFGKTAGIIGLGRNGYYVANLCKAFKMKVIAHDPFVNQEKMEAEGFHMVELDELMEQADYVVVLARLSKATEGMVGREQIARMKHTACLINPGRGKLIDNDAVFDALDEDKIRMAALDAHAVEPLGKEHRAMKISSDKLILTPHMAGKTHERNWHQYQLLIGQFEAYIKGDEIRYPYTPRVAEGKEYASRGGALRGILKESEA